MTLFIQDYETEDVLFSTQDAITAPEKGESILLNNKWYEVVDRNFSFKHLSVIDDNKCAIFVRPFKVKEEPVSENLDEVGREWLRPQLDKDYANYGEGKMMELTRFDGYAMLDAIEFGAQWQKNKMVENAMDGIIAESAGGDGWVNVMTGFVKSEDVNVKFGDKIKIIVIKED